MLCIPRAVSQVPAQDQLEMDDNYFFEENHISLAQASQRPVKII